MIHILVIEDDEIQRNNLVKIISSVSDEIRIHEADCKDDAMEIAMKYPISFMYIDIMLKNSTGLDFAKELREIPRYQLTWLIFLTTHVDYMLEAFKEIHCYDYILKPYDKQKIIDTTKLLIENKYEQQRVFEDEREAIVIELQGTTYKFFADQIVFIEVSLRTCMVHLKTETHTLNRMPLKKLLEMIESDFIIQTHKSFAVNVRLIDRLEKISRGSWEIYFEGYDEVALLATTYKEALRAKLMD